MPRSDATLNDRVRMLDAHSSIDLRRAIFADAKQRGRAWALNGPRAWNKDQLINYCLRECVHVPGVPDGR